MAQPRQNRQRGKQQSSSAGWWLMEYFYTGPGGLDILERRGKEGSEMPVMARKPASNFIPAPEGTHQAVCVDVWPEYTAESEYNGVRKKYQATRIVWHLDAMRDDGLPYQVTKQYRLSTHERSNLRKDLEIWRGKKFTEAEIDEFDVEKLIGANCLISVVHNEKEGTTYANVGGISKVIKGMAALPVTEGYIRKQDRPEDNNGSGAKVSPDAIDETDDGEPLPF